MSQLWGTRWHSLFRHCVTSQKFGGSIPDGDIEIFHLLNPSGRTVTLGSTRPLTEMCTRGISKGKWVTNLHLHVQLSKYSGNPNLLEP